jgi:hypothetical protein
MVINRKGRRGIAQRPQRKIRLRPLRISLRSRMFVFGKNIIFSCYRGQAK